MGDMDYVVSIANELYKKLNNIAQNQTVGIARQEISA